MSLSSKSGSLASGFLIFAALLTLPSSVAGEEPTEPDPNPARVVAIGDIHGEFDGLVSILQETRLIDDQLRWIGENTTLVQTGDFLDRGPGVREVVELLMNLERQATEQGGRMIVLMGNHESMNLLRNYQDVTPEIFASFATDDSEERRRKEYKVWVNWMKRLMHSRGQSIQRFNAEVKRRWIEEHPLGFFEYQDVMGPDGAYGAWISRLQVGVRIGDTLFMHAGISPEFAQYTLESINRMHWAEIESFLLNRAALVEEGIIHSAATLQELFWTTHPENRSGWSKRRKALLEKEFENLKRMQRLLLDRASPLWFRGYSPPRPDGSFGLSDEELEPLVEKLTEVHGTKHFVAAHSTYSGGVIGQRLGGRVFLIDTGMLESYHHGRPSALEIQGGLFTAVYVNERQVLLDSREDVVPMGTSARTMDYLKRRQKVAETADWPEGQALRSQNALSERPWCSPSFGEVQAAQQVLEAGVVAQGLEGGIPPEPRDIAMPLLVRRFEPSEGLILLPQSRIDLGQTQGIPDLAFLFQFSGYFPRLIPPAGQCIGMPKAPSPNGADLTRLLVGRDSLLVHPFFCIGPSQDVQPDREIGIQFE